MENTAEAPRTPPQFEAVLVSMNEFETLRQCAENLMKVKQLRREQNRRYQEKLKAAGRKGTRVGRPIGWRKYPAAENCEVGA